MNANDLRRGLEHVGNKIRTPQPSGPPPTQYLPTTLNVIIITLIILAIAAFQK